MRLFFQILLTIFLFSLLVSEVFPCSCVSDSLDKRFRKAKAIFIGKVADEDDLENKSLVQNNKEGLIILEVVKSWKGIKKEYVGIDFDTENLGASCPTLYTFEEDKEYLVFAYGNDFKVAMVCSDTLPVSSEYYSTAQREIRKLDSFSFRFWSRLNLF